MNLKSIVYKLISAKSRDAADLFDVTYSSVVHQDPASAIRHMNIFWRTELAVLPQDTIYARTSLNDNCTPEQWVVLFSRDVVPAIVNYWLPATYVAEGGIKYA